MSESAYTVVIHGNDTTGKPTLIPAFRAAGQVVYARGDENHMLEDAIVVRSFESPTLQRARDDRATHPTSHTDKDGVHRKIVRIILDTDLPVLQGRLAKWPSTDLWESEKTLFYFCARFLVCSSLFVLLLDDAYKFSGTSRILRSARHGYGKEER
jgi:hypothetical protein